MKQQFYVLKGDDGELYPMAFITVADAGGELRKDAYTKKLDEGEIIVKVEMSEIPE